MAWARIGWLASMSDHDLVAWTLVFTVLAAVVAILAFFVAVRTRRDAQQVATAQGIFEQPTLVCALISERCPKRIVLGTNLHGGRINEINLPLSIRNAGRKQADDVTLYIRVPKDLAYGNHDVEVTGQGAAATIRKVTVALVASGNFVTVVIGAPKVATYEALSITLPFSIATATQAAGEAHATLRDGARVTVPFSTFFAYQITMVVACDGARPVTRTRTYSLEVIDTAGSSLRDAIDKRNELLRGIARAAYEKNEGWSDYGQRSEPGARGSARARSFGRSPSRTRTNRAIPSSSSTASDRSP